MTREEIIQGLKFTVDMVMFDPTTGETRQGYELNDMDRTTVEACKGAMELLRREPKTGHWINEDVNGLEYYRCSECRSSPWDFKTKCCPDCGAKMEV